MFLPRLLAGVIELNGGVVEEHVDAAKSTHREIDWRLTVERLAEMARL